MWWPSSHPAAEGRRTASYDDADGLSPSYKPNAPVRTVVGQGHVLTGVVRVATNRYHPEGRPTGRFDILLTPAAG